MINYLDVFYDRRTDQTYYADVVTPEVSILRPVRISSLGYPSLSRNSGCMVLRRQSDLSDCKMVCTDLQKLIPVNDLGQPDYSLAPYIKIGVLQGGNCKAFFENRDQMEYAQTLRNRFREEQAQKEKQEQKDFDEEISCRKVFEHPSGDKIIVCKTSTTADLSKKDMPTATPPATNPSPKSSSSKAKRKPTGAKGRGKSKKGK